MRIRNHHLSEKISRKPKREQVRKNKRELGRSIEERPDIDNKLEFGHWEADLVIGVFCQAKFLKKATKFPIFG